MQELLLAVRMIVPPVDSGFREIVNDELGFCRRRLTTGRVQNQVEAFGTVQLVNCGH